VFFFEFFTGSNHATCSNFLNNFLPISEMPEVLFIFATGLNGRLDFQIKQGVECSATNPKNEKKYAFHLLLLENCAP
jgi:hypothetical protein